MYTLYGWQKICHGRLEPLNQSRDIRPLRYEHFTFADRVNLIWSLSVALDVASDLDAILELIFENVNLREG